MLPALLALSTTLDSPEELGVFERFGRRDTQALAEIFDRYGKPVFSLILRIVRNPAAAEDLTLEVFLRAWNRALAFDRTQRHLGAFLITLARDCALDYQRALEGRAGAPPNGRSSLRLVRTNAAGESDPLDPDPARKLRQAFDDLAPEQRSVLELAYFEGLTLMEVAEKLGQPLATVKACLHSALEVVRRALAAETAP